MQTFKLDFPALAFTEDDYRKLGGVAIEAELGRIGKAIDVADQPAKPLDIPYARAKARKGLQAIRDLRNTGALLASRAITAADSTGVDVGFSSPQQEEIAAKNNMASEMFGLSPDNIQVVQSEAERIFAAKFSK